MKDKEKKQLMWIVGIIAAVILLYPYLNLQKFIIGDSDFIYEGVNVYPFNTSDSPYNYTNEIISFYQYGIQYNFTSGTVYYTLDTNLTPLSSIPIVNGSHLIRKYQLDITNNNTKISVSRWILAMISETKVVQLNVTGEQICKGLKGNWTSGKCLCPDGNIWYDNSTIKYCGPVTVTTTITINPTFWQTYSTAIIVGIILSLVIAYLMFFDRKKI